MKSWKKWTVVLLSLGICIGFAACGVGSSEGEGYYTPGVVEDTDHDFTDEYPAEQLGYDSIEDMNLTRSRGMFKWALRMVSCSSWEISAAFRAGRHYNTQFPGVWI